MCYSNCIKERRNGSCKLPPEARCIHDPNEYECIKCHEEVDHLDDLNEDCLCEECATWKEAEDAKKR